MTVLKDVFGIVAWVTFWLIVAWASLHVLGFFLTYVVVVD